MPYKDFQRKKEWERQHRPERLARRRELRRTEAARKEIQPEAPRAYDNGTDLLLPLVAGGALASYDPMLAMGAGGLTLLLAALYKKGLSWWIVGLFILAVAFIFQQKDRSTNE